MKRLIFLLSACIAIGCVYINLPYGSSVNSSPHSTLLLASSLEEEHRIVDMLARMITELEQTPAIWPNYFLREHPLAIVFNSGHIYAFNLKNPSSVWEESSFSQQKVFFSSLDHWGLSRLQMQSDFSIDGESAFVFHFDLIKGNPLEPMLNLLHDRFHIHQYQHFQNPHITANGYLDHFNVLNIAWMQIEEMILADFLNAQLDSERSYLHKASHLNDFIIVHRLRQRLLKPASIAWEAEQQRLQGTADYIALKSMERIWNLSTFSGVERLLASLEAPGLNEEILERTMVWRNHAVGAALCYALDFLEVPKWKERLSDENISLSLLLESIVEIKEEEMMPRIEKIKGRYTFDSVQTHIIQAMEEYGEEVAELMGEYAEMEGVEVEFCRREKEEKSREGSSLYTYYLNDGSALTLADTSTHRDKDSTWSLRTFGAPMVRKQLEGSFLLKLEEGAQVKIDGDILPLSTLVAQKSSRTFKELAIRGLHCEFHSIGSPGRLYIHDGRLKISLEPVLN